MEQKRFPKPFKFCEYYVEDFVEQANFNKVNMKGMYETLLKLRDIIADNFQEVNYMTYEFYFNKSVIYFLNTMKIRTVRNGLQQHIFPFE